MNTTKLVAEPGQKTILIEREFDGPRHLVWKAMTTPDLVKRWWGPRSNEMIECTMDVRVGGQWRFLVSACGNPPIAFYGEYREIVPNEKVVQTFIYEPYPQAPALETMTLHDLPNGRTLMKVVHDCVSIEARDGMFNSGMEGGMRETHDRLDELVKTL